MYMCVCVCRGLRLLLAGLHYDWWHRKQQRLRLEMYWLIQSSVDNALATRTQPGEVSEVPGF